jgi:murein DD-endopeptidase MepM/ murein hydrolase activator NlpD
VRDGFDMLNIIVVSRHLRAPRKLAFNDPRVAGVTGAIVLAVLGLAFATGYFARGANGAAGDEIAGLQRQLGQQQAQLKAARDDAQREINAIAARVGELQAQANRLNALGERLTQSGKLGDGEFNFDRVPGMGGAESVADVAAGDLLGDLDRLQAQFDQSGHQLSVLEAMLYDQQVQQASIPSSRPSNGYITSGFGTRVDPFRGGRAHHLGIDFDANTGDPVRAAADGVVSYVGTKSGYGNVVEIDHGNGYTTLYGHNSRFSVKVGDLVRVGQEVAKAGSTGRSTGPHVHFEVHVNGRQVNPRPFLDRQQRR